MFELIDSYNVTVLENEAVLVEVFHSKVKTLTDECISLSFENTNTVSLCIKAVVNDEFLMDSIDITTDDSFRFLFNYPIVSRYAYRTKFVFLYLEQFSDKLIDFVYE